MVSPSINFDYVFVLILFIYVYIFCFLCVCFFSNKSLQFSFSPFILLLCTLILISGILNGQFQDEIEHLHCSWMFAKGLVPFKDFWQHHSPMIWLVLSVFLKKISPTPYIVIISRLFCVVVFFLIGLMGWQIAKTIWNKEARLSTYLLVLLSTAIYTECLVLRPEIFLGLFLLLGIYFTLQITEDKTLTSFWAGLFFSLAASFSPKQFLIYLIPFIVIFLGNKKVRFPRFLFFILGFLLGACPLLIYLVKNGIFDQFIRWVYLFNIKRIEIIPFFSLVFFCLGLWGPLVCYSRYKKEKESKYLILVLLYFFSFTSSIITTQPYPYCLQFSLMICAIALSGFDLIKFLMRFNSVVIRNILLSCFLALLITPNLLLIIKHNETFLIDDEKMMSNLIGYCKDSNCLTIVPNHPVFTQDTTRMYTQWYLCFLKDKKEIKRDFDLNNVIKEIIMKKPVVVITGRYSFNFLLSKSDSNRWESFLNKNYTIKVIEGRKFYIRNDKLLVRHVY